MSRPEMVESLLGDQTVMSISRDQRVDLCLEIRVGVSAQRSEGEVIAQR